MFFTPSGAFVINIYLVLFFLFVFSRVSFVAPFFSWKSLGMSSPIQYKYISYVSHAARFLVCNLCPTHGITRAPHIMFSLSLCRSLVASIYQSLFIQKKSRVESKCEFRHFCCAVVLLCVISHNKAIARNSFTTENWCERVCVAMIVWLIGAQEACFIPIKLEQCMKFKKLLCPNVPRCSTKKCRAVLLAVCIFMAI